MKKLKKIKLRYLLPMFMLILGSLSVGLLLVDKELLLGTILYLFVLSPVAITCSLISCSGISGDSFAITVPILLLFYFIIGYFLEKTILLFKKTKR